MNESFTIVPHRVLAASDGAVKLYAVIASYANEKGEAWPSRTTLAKDMACGRSKVDRLLRELKTLGHVTVERRHDAAGDWTSNLYRVAPRVKLGSPTGEATLPQERGHGGVTGEATGSPTSDAQNKNQSELDPIDLERPIPARESLGDPLVARLIGTCKKKDHREAVAVIDHLRQYVDDRIIDQGIGTLANYADPPRQPRVLIPTVQSIASSFGVRIPALHLNGAKR